MESTVYKPSIYNAPTIYKNGGGGGGGGGGISCIRCTKATATNYIQIPINTYSTATFEIGVNTASDWNRNNTGIFSGIGSAYYPPISFNMQGMDTTNYGFYVFDKSYSTQMSIKIYPNNFNFYYVKISSENNNSKLNISDLYGNVKSNSKGSLMSIDPITSLRLFVSDRSGNDTIPGVEIYYFRVGNILDLIPDEQNGVPGFTDTISGNFYGPLVNDGTFEAVKPRAPI